MDEATLESRGTSLREAIRALTLIAAPQAGIVAAEELQYSAIVLTILDLRCGGFVRRIENSLAEAAQKAGKLIVPFHQARTATPSSTGTSISVSATIDPMTQPKPAFDKGGTVTAAKGVAPQARATSEESLLSHFFSANPGARSCFFRTVMECSEPPVERHFRFAVIALEVTMMKLMEKIAYH